MRKKIIMAVSVLLLGMGSVQMAFAGNSTSVETKASENQIILDVSEQEDIAEELDDALKEARNLGESGEIITVTVPKGSYQLGETLHIFSNTTLSLEGVELHYTGEGNIIMTGTSGSYKNVANYNNSTLCSGYNGFQNISIQGGTFYGAKENTSTLIRLAHAKNVRLNGVTLSGGGAKHQMEVAAINGFYVTNSVFRDYGEVTGTSTDKQEALQLDLPLGDTVFRGVYADGTTMKNVTVTGCTFQNVPRGIGSHSMLHGAYHENIKISGNQFINVLEEAIIGLNYYNCEIKGNTIKNCGAGVLFQYFKPEAKAVYTTTFNGTKTYKGTLRHDAKTTISGNVITVKYAESCSEAQGIKVLGGKLDKAVMGWDNKKIAAGNFYISGVTIQNNTITTAGHGIHISNARQCVVKGNQIEGKNHSTSDKRNGRYDAIFAEQNCSKIAIVSNSMKNMPRNGIFIQNQAYASRIEKNTIVNCKEKGISFYNKSGVSGDISGNTIKKSKECGIMLNTNCTVNNISQNVMSDFTDANSKGIHLYAASSVKGAIEKNTISNVTGKGIYVNDTTKKSTVKTIKNNKISKIGSQAINITSIKNNVTISGNTISETKDNVIIIQPNTKKYQVTIKNNIISGTSKSGGVRVISGKVLVQGNTISHVKTGVFTNEGVSGKIYINTYGKKVATKLNIAGQKKSLAPAKTSVKKASSKGKKKADIRWKKSSKAAGYEVQYTTDANFQSAVKTKTLTKPESTVSLSGLTSKKVYYVRVAGYKKWGSLKVYSDFSKAKKVKVK